MPRQIKRRRREEFTVRLSVDDLVHVVFDKENNHIVRFSVQYLAFIDDEWRPIVRFDTAHGRAHMDVSHPDGSQETRELQIQNYQAALSWATQDVRTRWEFYRQRYEMELR